MFPGFYGEGVIEFCLRPEHVGGIVTEFTIRRKTGNFMIGVLCRIIVCFMTTKTLSGQVQTLHMACRTVKIGVSALQGPIRVVGNIDILPTYRICSMTDLAVGMKAKLFVIRIFGTEIILQVAKDTNCGQPLILATAMAVGTVDHSMLALQRERIMAELRPLPSYSLCSVAGFTVERIVQPSVVRIPSVVVVVPVAEHTIRGQPFILAAAVAFGTISHTMLTFQRKIAMSKVCTFPRNGICAMTGLACCGKARVPMVGVLSVVIVCLMAEHTF